MIGLATPGAGKRNVWMFASVTQRHLARPRGSPHERHAQPTGQLKQKPGGDRAPERLQLAAGEAARSGDLQTTIEYANGARHTIRLWNEFRVWDPGD